MKHTLLIALLGATVTLATPTLSFAENGYKERGGSDNHLYQNRQKSDAKRDRRHHKNKHKNDQKRFVAKPPKTHRIAKNNHNRKHGYNKHGFNKHGYNRHGYNKHGYNKHGYNKHKQRHHSYHNKNKPSFSISWNVGDSTVSYGNDSYAYNQGYNNHNYQKPRGQRIYKRIHRQANRIQNGVNNGQLVRREAKRLRHEQRDIKQTMAHYKRDGHLNKHERSKLNHLLDVASNNIHRKSNNHRTRYSQQQRHNNNHNYYVQF
ncbi:MAG: hypothetical protein V7749_03360 [Cocleimonas sp.]